MPTTKRTIEVDEQTADLLEARAAARGMNVPALLADMASNESALPAELAQMRATGDGPWSPDVLRDDARRLAKLESSREGVPWSEVETWLRSWGAPNELPTPKARKL
jgi:hypothetical protein